MKHGIVPGRHSTEPPFGTTRDEFDADVAAIRDAILRQLVAGSDVGELLYQGVKAAQEHVAEGYTILDNEPGSWEAKDFQALVRNAIQDVQESRPAG